MTRFITIGGKMQTGKTTSANIIKNILINNNILLENKIHLINFADPLKDACSIIFGVDRKLFDTIDGKNSLTEIIWPTRKYANYQWMPFTEEWHKKTPSAPKAGERMTVRELLQFVGTNLLREQLDPDVWIKSVYCKQYKGDDLVIVADCRFPNEADFGKGHGLLIKIERQTGLEADTHKSEVLMDDYRGFDYIIENNGTLEELRDKVRVVLLEQGII
jgi:hypothetical protein